MRKLKPFVVAIPLVCLAALAWSSPAGAQTVPFKVYITELWQLDAGVDPGLGLIGDYYAKVTINGVEQNNNGACDEETSTGLIVPFQLFKNFEAIPECSAFRTPWVFKMQVPAGQPVHVRIQIFDSDLAFDDEGDAKPGPGNDINLVVDPATGGQWSGDFSWPQDCSRPNLDLGGNNVNVCWQAGFDSDDDGLLDVWEQFGVDTDNDGVIDINLPALGANPLHKDVFVEADFLQASNHSHSPKKDAIDRIVTSFANAPVTNADGTTGVQLHVDVGPLYGAGSVFSINGAGGVVGTYGDLGGGGGAIPEAGNEIISFDGGGSSVKFADLKAANFNSVRESIFRYTIFGHQTNVRAATNDCTSGVADQERRDFLVTLGGVDKDGVACWGTDGGGFSVGSTSEQGGTFMHEMGHTLGLRHGGDIEINNKPNYLSVMNYSFQSCGVPSSPGLLPGGCDYSRLVSGALLPPLDETDLDECVGIGGGLGFGAVDWNGDGLFEGVSRCGPIFANTNADVNNDGVCVSPGPDKTLNTTAAGDDRVKEKTVNDGMNRVCSTTASSTSDDVQTTAVGSTPAQPNPLKSFDDWGGMNPSLIDLGIDWVFSGSDQEPDPKTLRDARRYMSEMTAPNVALDETGPATAKPGDLLNYTVKITNTGRGPALSAVLKETNPDGTAQTTGVGIIAVGSEVTHSSSFAVPANACPGTFTGASAALSFKDFVGNDLTAADTVPLQILDVAAPTLDVSVSPAVLWPPDHKFQDVTATITVKDNCDPNPTVTLVSITSNEPATGVIGIGQGDQGPDIQGAAFGTDDRTFSLRAERGTGQGSTGRVYTITYRVTDASGNATVSRVTVTVPTSNNGK